MESIIFILLITILVVVLMMRTALQSKISELNQRIDGLVALIQKVRETQLGERERVVPKAVTKTPEVHVPERQITTPEKLPPSPPPSLTPPEPEQKRKPEEVKIPGVITPQQVQRAPKPAAPPRPGFFERNPDLEKFIGENLANKIGIAILVLGIGFFVKYAIDQNWIGVYGRVLIGIACGGALIGIAHFLRKKFIAFSSVLVGGGIAILYLTIAIAFHEYGIMGQKPAFAIMVVITALTIMLSVAYNRIELAVLAILGGFASPFMVSRGEGSFVVLFTYIMVLDIGMLVLAYFKKWNLVNIIAYIFTVILFGSWLATGYDETNVSMITGAMVFSTLFYFTFFAMTVVNNLKQRVPFKAPEFMLLLSNTFLYYSAGMVILNNPDSEIYKGLFTAFIGIFNFIFAFALFRKSEVDRNLVFLLIGLVLTFISLAAPVQLEGNYITLFWAAEAVLLLWLSQKSGILLMKIASVVVMVLMWISLGMDWSNVYYLTADDQAPVNILLNKGYITSVVALIAIGLFYRLLSNEESGYKAYVPISRTVLTLAAAFIFYASNLIELTYQLNVYVEDFAARTTIIGTYNMFFILLVLALEKRLYLPDYIKSGFALWGVLMILSYFSVYHYHIILTRNLYLQGESSMLGFGFHYLLVIQLIVIAAWSLKRFRLWTDFNQKSYNLYSWFFVFFFVFLASAELDHTVLLTAGVNGNQIYDVLRQNHKIGYPILWGITAFLLIVVGLRTKRKQLRIISLTLMLITLVKLFLFDIKGISKGGMIAAFISLGALLLIVSFMYQRLKKLLLVDEASDEKAKEV